MYNILNSISFVNLYTELATVIRLAVVVVFFFLNLASRCVQLQEPITRSLHLPYKPFESTLSDEKLFIEIIYSFRAKFVTP